MGRRPRVILQGFPHHVVQRGHNHKAVFVQSADYQYYLDNLLVWKAHYSVGVLAYCLMTNHVHLLLVPYSDPQAVSGLMRRLAARQGRLVNRLEQRVGTLWSGRFKCSVVDTDAYLLACMRYIELNPVRAGMVTQPEHYAWSSYQQRMNLVDANWLDVDPITPGLGHTPAERRAAYREYLRAGINDKEYRLIRDAVTRNQLTGDGRFIAEIERRTGQRIENRGRGRPKK
jgi:putative transposase